MAATAAVHDKVVAATLGTAFSQVLIWAFEAVSKVDMPTAIEGSFAVIVTFALGYFVPESKPATK